MNLWQTITWKKERFRKQYGHTDTDTNSHGHALFWLAIKESERILYQIVSVRILCACGILLGVFVKNGRKIPREIWCRTMNCTTNNAQSIFISFQKKGTIFFLHYNFSFLLVKFGIVELGLRCQTLIDWIFYVNSQNGQKQKYTSCVFLATRLVFSW